MIPMLCCRFLYLVFAGMCSAIKLNPCCASSQDTTESGSSRSSTENSERSTAQPQGFLPGPDLLAQFFRVKGALELIRSTYGGGFISEANSDMWREALRGIPPYQEEYRDRLHNSGDSVSSEGHSRLKDSELTVRIGAGVEEILGTTYHDLVCHLTEKGVKASPFDVFAAVIKLIMLSEMCSSYRTVDDDGGQKTPHNPSVTFTESERSKGQDRKEKKARVHDVLRGEYGCDCIQSMRDWLFGRDERVKIMSGVILEAAGLKRVPNSEKHYSLDIISLLCEKMKMEIDSGESSVNFVMSFCYRGTQYWDENEALNSLEEFKFKGSLRPTPVFSTRCIKILYLCEQGLKANTDLISSSGILLFLLVEFLRLRGAVEVEVIANCDCHGKDTRRTFSQPIKTPPSTLNVLNRCEWSRPIEGYYTGIERVETDCLVAQTFVPTTGYEALLRPLRVSAEALTPYSFRQELNVDLRGAPENCLCYFDEPSCDMLQSLLFRVHEILQGVYGPVLPEGGKCVSKHVAIPYGVLKLVIDPKRLGDALLRLGVSGNDEVGSISILFEHKKRSSFHAFFLEFLGGKCAQDVCRGEECQRCLSSITGKGSSTEVTSDHIVTQQRQVREFVDHIQELYGLVKVRLKVLSHGRFLLSFLAGTAVGNAGLQDTCIHFYDRDLCGENAELLQNAPVSEVIFEDVVVTRSFAHYFKEALCRGDAPFSHLKVVRLRFGDFPAHLLSPWILSSREWAVDMYLSRQWRDIIGIFRSKNVKIYWNEVLQA